MRAIILTKGRIATVDDEDFDRVNQFKWCASKRHSGGYYAIRRVPGAGLERLHNFILGVPGVDHRDGDGLDNRRGNLRAATTVENNRGFRNKRASTSSQYRGVTFDSQNQKWRAKIGVGSVAVHLGRFESELEAAQAYDAAAKEHYGSFATSNLK